MKIALIVMFALTYTVNAFAFGFRQARITIAGNVYEPCFITTDDEIYCLYTINPGESVCGTDLIIEYDDNGDIQTPHGTYCAHGGECMPGQGECSDGLTPIKMCSEYTFACTQIYTDYMELYSLTADVFSCKQGYYKNRMDCMPCPELHGIAGTTETSGATGLSQCFLSTQLSFTDDNGTFQFDENCFYTP